MHKCRLQIKYMPEVLYSTIAPDLENDVICAGIASKVREP